MASPTSFCDVSHVYGLFTGLSSSDLSLGDRLDPAEGQVDDNGDYTNDPQDLGVVLAIVAKDDSENDTTEVPCSTSTARYNAYHWVSRFIAIFIKGGAYHWQRGAHGVRGRN